MKKILAMLLALVLVLSMGGAAMAADTGSITIQNAAKGEAYSIYKLFDASVTGKEDGSIVYTGTIPDELKAYFTTENGYVVAVDKNATELSSEAVAAMQAWAESQTPTATKTGDGGAVVFDNLEYGYYVITTTQGSAITVTSTNPDATIFDKTSKEPGIVKGVDDADVAIGQTVTYTATSTTVNYLGAGKDAQQVVKYEVSDTLPEFLTDVTVTSIVVDNDGNAETKDDQITLDVQQFDENKKITVDWVDENGNSKYNNGALLIITYTAKVTDKAIVDGDGNKNEVTLQPYVKNPENPDEPKPWEKTWKDDEIIKTYAATLEKVDENKAPLAGAKFAVNGLIVNGSNGNYTVVSYDPESTTQGTVMETDAEGKLIIKGLPSDVTLSVIETEAPAGYNKLTDPVELKPTIISETVTVTTTTVYYDENGEETETVTSNSKVTIEYNDKLEAAAVQVVNNKGSQLPETGGIGTTIFYVAGGILMLFAVVVLVTRKKMSSEN